MRRNRVSLRPRSVGRARQLVAAGLLFVLAACGGEEDDAGGAIRFARSTLSGTNLSRPTSLQFGPDGRLYVSEQRGLIRIYGIERRGPNDYAVLSTDTIRSVNALPNHDDHGLPDSDATGRLVTGLFVTGTAEHPVVYVSSSDPRLSPPKRDGATTLDTNSGVISRITWTGSRWEHLDLVRGLPRAIQKHGTHGLQLDASTNTLYVAQGGNTNRGAPASKFSLLPEYALSAAILAIDLDAIGDATYDLPTLDDEDRPGIADHNDPLGGNLGKNQAVLVPGGPVSVHASGFRNPYDLVLTGAGRMYTVDNGPNGGWGDVPIGEGPEGRATNEPSEEGERLGNGLHHVAGRGYYGGHPNPTRSNPANTFNASNPQSPVHTANPIESDFRSPGDEDGSLAVFDASTNGIAEYTASPFDGIMRGNLLVASLDNSVRRIALSPDGTEAVSSTVLFHAVGNQPLDLTVQGDDGAFPGTIWVADREMRAIHVFEPGDGSRAGVVDPADSDGDGYTNEDELANGTSPDSAADFPPDHDGDLVSNRLDPDDDDDGLPDTEDPFAIDPDNGTTTPVGLVFDWGEDRIGPGGLLNLGFTGLMTSGADDYESLFDTTRLTAGGAAGVLTLDEIGEGTAAGAANDQRQAFQFGVDVASAAGPVSIHTRVLTPFARAPARGEHSVGLFLGTGGQDDYVEISLTSREGSGEVGTRTEVAGRPGARSADAVSLDGLETIDLYLVLDPSAASVQAAYAITSGGTIGARIELGAPHDVPRAWLGGDTGLAVGVLCSSRDAELPVSATWELIEAVPVAATGVALAKGRTTGFDWRRAAPSPIPRVEAGRVVHDGRLYVFGGFFNNDIQATRQVHVYDPKANVWTRLADMPSAVTHVAPALDGTPGHDGAKVWFAGGLDGDHPARPVDRVWIYHIDSNTWSSGPDLPVARGGGGSAIVGRRLHSFGGLGADRKTDQAEHWTLDLDDPTGWQRAAPMPDPRNQSGIAVLDGLIYVVGGQRGHDGGNEDTDLLHVYDPATDRWRELARLPDIRSHAESGTFVHQGRIVTMGGNSSRAAVSTDVFAYDPATDTWAVLPPLAERLQGVVATVIDGLLIVGTGSTSGTRRPQATMRVAPWNDDVMP